MYGFLLYELYVNNSILCHSKYYAHRQKSFRSRPAFLGSTPTWLSLELSGRGDSIIFGHQKILRLLGFSTEAKAMPTAAEDAGNDALGVFAEEFCELCLMLDTLTCRVDTNSEGIE